MGGWQYTVTTGELSLNGNFEGIGYSGRQGYWRNNPSCCGVTDYGPIPTGEYRIGETINDPHMGPCSIRLIPLSSTNTFGRSGFFIHGNNVINDASHGCVIMGPSVREMVSKYVGDILTVTP